MTIPLLNYSTARDAIFGAILVAWNTNAPSVFGAAADLRWQGVEELTALDRNSPWGYVAMVIANSRKLGLRNDQSRRYTTTGVVTLDVYTPRHGSQASSKALLMADYVRRAIQGPRVDGVVFKNVTATPSGQTTDFVVVRLMADFEYTEEG